MLYLSLKIHHHLTHITLSVVAYKQTKTKKTYSYSGNERGVKAVGVYWKDLEVLESRSGSCTDLTSSLGCFKDTSKSACVRLNS